MKIIKKNDNLENCWRQWTAKVFPGLGHRIINKQSKCLGLDRENNDRVTAKEM